MYILDVYATMYTLSRPPAMVKGRPPTMLRFTALLIYELTKNTRIQSHVSLLHDIWCFFWQAGPVIMFGPWLELGQQEEHHVFFKKKSRFNLSDAHSNIRRSESSTSAKLFEKFKKKWYFDLINICVENKNKYFPEATLAKTAALAAVVLDTSSKARVMNT